MASYSPSYSLTLRLRYAGQPGQWERISTAITDGDGRIGAVDIVEVRQGQVVHDITVSVRDVEHGQTLVRRIETLPGVHLVRASDRTFQVHRGGKLEVCPKTPLQTRDDLAMIYTPGVARICRAIYAEPNDAFQLTIRHNMVAVVTDGSAVLGLGNIGPRAALPVMEGKAVLFKEFGHVDAFPICLDTQDTEEIIATCRYLAPTFGGINLEDIAAPRCFEIEERLSAMLDIPVFHDDQHATAIVVLAALENALKLVDKTLPSLRVTINGAGAAGVAIAKLLKSFGVEDLVVCDSLGAIYQGRLDGMNASKQWLAHQTNPRRVTGSLHEAIVGADVFIGVSVANVLEVEDLQRMADERIVFALANPDPEIDPEVAKKHAAIVATGRSDYPNQINNVLCFPGFFRGLLDARARHVTEAMKLAAVEAIAGVLSREELIPDNIVPSVLDRRVATAVAHAVARAAAESGMTRRRPHLGQHVLPS